MVEMGGAAPPSTTEVVSIIYIIPKMVPRERLELPLNCLKW